MERNIYIYTYIHTVYIYIYYKYIIIYIYIYRLRVPCLRGRVRADAASVRAAWPSCAAGWAAGSEGSPYGRFSSLQFATFQIEGSQIPEPLLMLMSKCPFQV